LALVFSGLRAADLAGTGGLDNRPINSESAVELTVEQRFLQDQEAAAAFWARIEEQPLSRKRSASILDDKRRGRCWSPTRYAAGAATRETPA
jgi:hypothetical protein